MEDPIFTGGYGDVYRGSLLGQAIAVKCLKMQQSNDAQIYQVWLLVDFDCSCCS
jgi:hypothetical protein